MTLIPNGRNLTLKVYKFKCSNKTLFINSFKKMLPMLVKIFNKNLDSRRILEEDLNYNLELFCPSQKQMETEQTF